MAESKETWPLAKKEAAINNQSDAGEEEEDHCQHKYTDNLTYLSQ